MTKEERQKRREQFFKNLNEEYPPIHAYIITNSGIVEPKPETEEEWANYHENLQFVEGTELNTYGNRI